MSNNIDRSRSKIHEMVVRGTDYREDYEFELYGEEVTAVLKPLVDDEFLPIAAFMAQHFDMEGMEEGAEAVSEAVDKVDQESDDDTIDVSKFDDEFVTVMQKAGEMGWHGVRDGNEVVELEDGEAAELIGEMMGGYSVELGSQVLEISGDVRDADKFRGKRGSVERSRDS